MMGLVMFAVLEEGHQAKLSAISGRVLSYKLPIAVIEVLSDAMEKKVLAEHSYYPGVGILVREKY